jgi:hypothetical protein
MAYTIHSTLYEGEIMPVATEKQRVTVHLKLDRPVRQEVIGNLHRQGLTMQEFFEGLMQALAADPARIADVRWLTDSSSDKPTSP